MRKLCCLIVLSVAAVCAALAASGLAAGSPTSQATTPAASAVTSLVTRATVQNAASASGFAVHSHGARLLPHSASPATRAAATATAAPRTASSGLTAAASSPLLANFNGTSSRDSAVTNFNQEFEPPDQGLCAGNGFVVDMVNSAYTVYKPNGSVVTGPFNINGPFGEGLTQFTSDPRCYYDPTTNTWFATILFISGGDFAPFGNTSHLDIAVNSPNGPTPNGNPGDPTNPWIVYQFDTTDAGGNGCPCFGDQPRIGVDSQNVYVTSDEFSITGNQFNGGQIDAFSKKDLVALSATVHHVHFAHLSVGGTVPLAPSPR